MTGPAPTAPTAPTADGPAATGGGQRPVPEGMPHLHVPDEPAGRKQEWLREVHGGAELEQVVCGPDGIVPWLWARWRSLGVTGFTEEDLAGITAGYRREIWLWLAGERTWAHCCSGLLGRIGRRVPG